jgi:hypothetical protein
MKPGSGPRLKVDSALGDPRAILSVMKLSEAD